MRQRRAKYYFVPLLIMMGICLQHSAQEAPEYNMADTLITDCDGFLFDSGGPDESYFNNDNLTFTVSTGGASIEVSFLSEVCIEDGFDILTIYDGEDDTGTLLASITGAGFIPPGVTASSGAVTFVFTSDASANYCGFEIFWNTIAGPPPPPAISVAQNPACLSNNFQLDFSLPIGCTWLEADSVSIIGDTELEVTGANVNCSGGQGNTALISLEGEFEYNCSYDVFVTMGIPDVCDSIWVYNLATSFTVDDCAPLAELLVDQDEICAGSCVTIEADVVGCNEHSFAWNIPLPDDAGPHEVCPEETTTYSVEITDLTTGNTVIENVTVLVNNPSIAINDTTFCQSTAPFVIGASPPSGYWEGNGFIDIDNGLFAPDSAEAGTNVLYYFLSATCYDSVLVDVLPIDVPEFSAACTGSDPYLLDAAPTGGVWSGEWVSPDGEFTPSEEGTFELIYTLDVCTDTTVVEVGLVTGPFELDTLCQSNWPDTIAFSPFGGMWTGPGIIDSLYGVFDPAEVPGGTYNLLYTVEGCSESYSITVKDIFTGSRTRSSCPAEAPFIPTPGYSPTGGYWEGDGIVDSNTGMYDPGSIPDDYWTALIYYAPNGCSDTIFYYNRTTVVPTDTMWWCAGDESLILDNETTGRAPFGGTWNGNGLENPEGNDFFFIPAVAGNGSHTLVYNANGCTDSLVMVVHPDTLLLDIAAMCSTEPAFALAPDLNTGGQWSGPGISDTSAGLFDPSQVGGGTHSIFWETPAGCNATTDIEVEQFLQAEIDGLDSSYCYLNQDFPVLATPAGGELTGDTGNDAFNPALAGPGTHELMYVWNGNYCSSDTTVEVFVFPSLEISLSSTDTIICENSSAQLEAEVLGGGPDVLYTYLWSDGLFGVNSNNVQPENGQYYFLEVSDGCSEPVMDSIFIDVLEPIEVNLDFSEQLCFGSQGGFASAEVSQSGNYSLIWEGDGTLSGDSIYADAGSLVSLNVEDLDYGCTLDTLVSIPSFTAISALFSANPNDDCVPWNSQPLEFIDFSQHGVTGLWDLGNGDIIPYEEGERVYAEYEQAGDFTVSLLIFNEGDCLAEYSLDICILPPTPIFIPDVFSPNGDGNNDMLFVRGRGIVDMRFEVYDQWGERVFTSLHPDQGWDGAFRGRKMPSGSYVWILSARLNDGSVEESRGEILLVR